MKGPVVTKEKASVAEWSVPSQCRGEHASSRDQGTSDAAGYQSTSQVEHNGWWCQAEALFM